MGTMRLFKHTVTGAVGEYPDHYGDVFPHLVPVDTAEPCSDCTPDTSDLYLAEDESDLDTDYYPTADEEASYE